MIIEKNITADKIIFWATCILTKAGLSELDAEKVSQSLVQTSLWGIDSHGIARIPHYLSRFDVKSINTNPNFKFTKTASATGRLDGDDGHGILIMTSATQHAIDLAKDAGIGAVGIENSSHCGAIGLYTRMIAKEGMVGIAFTHSDSLVTPFGGNKAFFGTNPISIAFPTENPNEPVCLDMATSIVPWNYVMNAKRDNTQLATGIGVDESGNETRNAADTVAVRPMAGYKGFALAFLIDMLCGPLNGMAFGPEIPTMYGNLENKRKLGSLVIVLDPEKFGGKNLIKTTGTNMINMLKSQSDEILFPGEPEYLKESKRLQDGIPITEGLEAEFAYWSKKLNVPEPEYNV